LFQGLLVIFTFGLIVVGVLQWRTLEKTDETSREFNRAFVFLHGIKEEQIIKDSKSSTWYFVANLENNGNTQTVNAATQIACAKPEIKDLFDDNGIPAPASPRVFGPKQMFGGGVCFWEADTLESDRLRGALHIIGGIVRYDDVFGHSHVTKFCREIVISADPRPIGQRLQYSTSSCSDAVDCSDKECNHKQ
jgi:hypothetical protein